MMLRILVLSFLIGLTSLQQGGAYLLDWSGFEIAKSESSEENTSSEDNEVREYLTLHSQKQHLKIARAGKAMYAQPAKLSAGSSSISNNQFFYSFRLYLRHRSIII